METCNFEVLKSKFLVIWCGSSEKINNTILVPAFWQSFCVPREAWVLVKVA